MGWDAPLPDATWRLRRAATRRLAWAKHGEPPHVHVTHGGKTAKYWLDPVELASSDGFWAHELNRVRALVAEHRTEFQRRWDEHFSA